MQEKEYRYENLLPCRGLQVSLYDQILELFAQNFRDKFSFGLIFNLMDDLPR